MASNGVDQDPRLILIVGLDSFIGSAAALELLSPSEPSSSPVEYHVRGTFPTKEKEQLWRSRYEELVRQDGPVQTVVLPYEDLSAGPESPDPEKIDLTESGGKSVERLRKAMEGVFAVLHCSSPVNAYPKDIEGDVLRPAVNGTLNVLRAAAASPSVKRVHILAAAGGIINPDKLVKGADKDYVYSEKDWNHTSYKGAKEGSPLFAYMASKALSERAAWAFMDQQKPSFGLTAFNPAPVFGPPPQPLTSINELNASLMMFWYLISKPDLDLRQADVGRGFIDVRDVAKAYLLSLQNDRTIGHRYLLSGSHYSALTALSFLRTTFPSLVHRMPTAPDDGTPAYAALSPKKDYDTSKMRNELGLVCRNGEETMKETAEALWALESAFEEEKGSKERESTWDVYQK